MDFLADLETRGLIQDSTDRDALRARIEAGPVGVYYGCDPSADSLQVGNLIGLLVLRRFADAGHNAIALAGGATGMIGDPGGKSKERNLLDGPTLKQNTRRIADQLDRISRVSLVNNLDWTEPVTLLEFLRDVGKHASVNQMIARESVKARLESENGISYTEFSYQLLQANDYLHLSRKHDVEIQIGGSDQWGNLLAGVDLIRRADGRHVHAFTWPLLLRSDGKKFGKSEEGAVWLAADRTSPYQFFQYWMNVADADIERFLLQLTLLPVAECQAVAAEHAQAPHRRVGQRRLAHEITTIVHGAEATQAAIEASAILFGGSPAGASAQALEFLATEVPTSPFTAGATLAAALAATPLASSLSDARRTIAQGAASVNGETAPEDRPLTEADLLYGRWALLRKGKRNYHLLDAATS
ncbi:tyrosine--tRNA ligase [Trebonia kvetii]|uniref:Tyrosine--tRNA ligase n=1 Tax=Trebonia kvetii TaxID=2480626 RepID=A0A6P2C283_9ACTN|nr:tyrosine--tRNA ligase [Trebonia kvetii]TVZ04401.1 tyrosine--tRNA ligase [Trebonia kvetii]